MTSIPTPYEDLLRDVMENGNDKGDRTGTGTRSVFGRQIRFDLSKGYPLIGTKKVFTKGIFTELLWLLDGDTNSKTLENQGVNIWREWGHPETGELGPIYGKQWRNWEAWNKVPCRKIDPSTVVADHIAVVIPDVNFGVNDSGMVGEIIDTETGKMQVFDEYRIPRPEGGKGYVRLRCVFLDTGFIVDNVTPQAARNGSVKDRFAPTVLGVGSLGNEVSAEDHALLYQTWIGVLKRCYDKAHVGYSNYGGRGVFVHPRWLTFENFVADAKKLSGWVLKKEYPSEYSLDKDYYSSNCYGPTTCLWLSKQEQSVNASTVKPIRITMPNGETCMELGVKAAARKLGVSHPTVSKYLESGAAMESGAKVSYVENDDEAPFRYRQHDQIKEVIAQIKHDPNSRRIIVNAWNVADIDKMALAPCHTFIQFYVANGKLSCQLYQRSADMFLGVPFNIASYALLTHMVAEQTGLEVGEFIHTFGDTHIYKNHFDQVALQLSREARPYPKLVIKRKPDSIFDYKLDDFEVVGYDPHPKIQAAVSV